MAQELPVILEDLTDGERTTHDTVSLAKGVAKDRVGNAPLEWRDGEEDHLLGFVREVHCFTIHTTCVIAVGVIVESTVTISA